MVVLVAAFLAVAGLAGVLVMRDAQGTWQPPRMIQITGGSIGYQIGVQATIKGGGEYRPLYDVKGLPCWPSEPLYDQLVEGTENVGSAGPVIGNHAQMREDAIVPALERMWIQGQAPDESLAQAVTDALPGRPRRASQREQVVARGVGPQAGSLHAGRLELGEDVPTYWSVYFSVVDLGVSVVEHIETTPCLPNEGIDDFVAGGESGRIRRARRCGARPENAGRRTSSRDPASRAAGDGRGCRSSARTAASSERTC